MEKEKSKRISRRASDFKTTKALVFGTVALAVIVAGAVIAIKLRGKDQ